MGGLGNGLLQPRAGCIPGDELLHEGGDEVGPPVLHSTTQPAGQPPRVAGMKIRPEQGSTDPQMKSVRRLHSPGSPSSKRAAHP